MAAGVLGLLWVGAASGQTPPQNPPAQQPPPRSPFEDVPEAPKPEAPKPQAQPTPPAPTQQPTPFQPVPEERKPEQPAASAVETPKPAAQPARADIIESIEFKGNRRIPRDTLSGRLYSKQGDPYDPEQLRRDFMLLWNTGFFDDVRLEVEPGTVGQIVRFNVVERRMVRSIKYEGNKSVTISEILDRFKERKVGLAVETRYDPTKIAHATNVLKDFLGERGRQYALVTPEIRQIPPSSIEIVFNITEGPKVKVGHINIAGNTVMSNQQAIRAMKNLRPLGVPHSIVLENLFDKTFDQSKLEEDKDRLRNAYQEKGYFRATVGEHTLTMRDSGGDRSGWFHLPLIASTRPGKRADLRIPIEEGKKYYVGKITFSDVKLFRTPDAVLRPYFQMQEGAIFDVSKLRKGMENLKKVYGEFGYIDFVAEPNFEFHEDEKPPKIDLSLAVDEGKQFFIRRINFSGNTTTRDKVIRREMMLDEGDMYNTRLWDLSILRLNQLGYFEPLKAEEAAQIDRDTRNGLVDLTLKVKERGKNSIGLTGGVSGFAGSFIGLNYSTNNFLGLGETLSLQGQLGSLQRIASFGFSEPYLFDKPIQTGFTVFTQSFHYNQAQQASILAGQDLTSLYNLLGSNNLQNFNQSTTGFTVYASYPLKRSFSRVGVTYGWDDSRVTTYSAASQAYFQYLDFQGVSGPNSLSGIKTSKIVPNYLYNTVNHPITPTGGKSLFVSTEFASAKLGGNVNIIQPTIDFKYFRSVNHRRNVVGMHFLGSVISGYSGRTAPPFSRYYIGGENDIRGFDIRTISPIAFIPDSVGIPVYNDNGTPRTQNTIVNGAIQQQQVTTTVPIYRLIFPGGDTQAVANFEYRIPIFGPVTVAPFFDAGVNRITFASQLAMNQDRIDQLNGQFPQYQFNKQISIYPGTQNIRASTGIELQIMMPVVNAPFRVYYAYNPLRLNTVLQPPVVADRSLFPNLVTYLNALGSYANPIAYQEPKKSFRFTISRTF